MKRFTGIVGVACVGVALAAFTGGCLVGPNYKRPNAPVADNYLDPGSELIKRTPADLTHWWTVFNDPVLNQLVQAAYTQNPTLQAAAVRVLEAQAQRGIAVGLLFPQRQEVFGNYYRYQLSKNGANAISSSKRSFGEWNLGGAANWELDLWGRYRRGIESADALVHAAVANYDDVLVSLIGDVVSEYVAIRIAEEQLAVIHSNIDLQSQGLKLSEARIKGGTATDLDSAQATALLRDTEAQIPNLEGQIAQGRARLCVLLGIPPKDLGPLLGDKQVIPAAPASVAIGIPADLLRRRPDIRRAERELAAQSARIGIAKADYFPAFSLDGTFGLAADDFSRLWSGNSVQAFGGPSFRWNVLNYGRIRNSVRVEDARFQAMVGAYENTVIAAQGEVETYIAGYLGAQRQVAPLNDSVAAAKRAVDVADTQYRGGVADFTRVLIAQQFLLDEQDRLIATRGAVALNLVSLYRSLGGGWELRDDHQPPLDDKTREEMRSRTNWGKMLQ
jgi:NodT family efflux transporter outer membrane factor (OMF) lipoprotein